MNRIEQLEKQVAVLREAIVDVVHADSSLSAYNVALAALAEADRIAAELVEASDWEVVMAWSAASGRPIEVVANDYVQLYPAGRHIGPFASPVEAAAWVRAQMKGEANAD